MEINQIIQDAKSESDKKYWKKEKDKVKTIIDKTMPPIKIIEKTLNVSANKAKTAEFLLELENKIPGINKKFEDCNISETKIMSLKKFFEEGLIYDGLKILPYCPRCGTGLASHEVAQGYKEISVNKITEKQINESFKLEHICNRLYSISKNDTDVNIKLSNELHKNLEEKNLYNFIVQVLFYIILEKKQPVYINENLTNVIEKNIYDTNISVEDIQEFIQM